MEENKEENGRKGLLATIIILCVVAVMIAAVVVALIIKQNKQSEGTEQTEETEKVLPEELEEDNLSAEDQVIKDTTLMAADSNKTDEDIEEYYDSVIEKALKDGNTELATRIIIQKMEFIAVTEEDCNKAKDYINGVNLLPYSISEKRYLSSYAISLATDCEDQELYDRWFKIYDEMEEE